MQHCIRELIKEEGLDLSSDDQEEEVKITEDNAETSKRGRPACPERWSRVISIYKDDLSKIKTYELGPELLLD